MENKITKNLIILGAIVFSFILTNNVDAGYYHYNYSATSTDPVYYEYNYPSSPDSSYYYGSTSAYNSSSSTDGKTVINNYYNTATATKVKTTATEKTTTDTSDSDKETSASVAKANADYTNNLGASAGNGITALSLRGSGGFMPSSIWQWIFVVILILVVVILARLITKKPAVVEEEIHAVHTH